MKIICMPLLNKIRKYLPGLFLTQKQPVTETGCILLNKPPLRHSGTQNSAMVAVKLFHHPALRLLRRQLQGKGKLADEYLPRQLQQAFLTA